MCCTALLPLDIAGPEERSSSAKSASAAADSPVSVSGLEDARRLSTGSFMSIGSTGREPRRFAATSFGLALGAEDAAGHWRLSLRGLRARKEEEASDADSESSSDSEDSSQEGASAGRRRGGIREWCPGLYQWLMDRATTRQNLAIIAFFLFFDAARPALFEHALIKSINTLSVFVVADVCSLVLALCISFCMEGLWALEKIFDLHGLWRFLGISVLFVCASLLNSVAYKTGLAPTLIMLLGKTYLPLTAVASVFAFHRKYGKLEWLSLSMLMLSIASFILLRESCHFNSCHFMAFDRPAVNFSGMIIVLMSVCMSACASMWAERIYKDRSKGLLRARGGGQRSGNRFYIFKAQMDLWTVGIWGAFWVVSTWYATMPKKVVSADPEGNIMSFRAGDKWFGEWSKRQYFLVAVLVAQSWLAGLTVQQFSTVSKGVVSSISTVLMVMLGDPITNRFHFRRRLVPSILITTIVLLSALVFQTGRINVRRIREKLNVSGTRHSTTTEPPVAGVKREYLKTLTKRLYELRSGSLSRGGLGDAVCRYSTVILYILADSFRSVILFVVQSNRYFVPQTMAVMSGVCGVLFASGMTLHAAGFEGLRKAWEPRSICKFLVCGALQAITTSLSSMAYALGTSPALVVALGKVYTPLVAVFSRCILGKYFMWLEWFALIILTSASFVFGLLEQNPEHAKTSPLAGSMCVVGSATSSCLMSLAMERLLRRDSDPYIMQKVRLDTGSVLFSVLLLPVMGVLGTVGGNTRHDLAFWVYRPGPDYWKCYEVAVPHPHNAARGCDQLTGEFLPDWSRIGNSTVLAERAMDCVCGRGVMLGWGSNWLIYAALAAVVFHSWITGLLVTQFSSVYRAVADGIPVLLIYFILDPLFSRFPGEPFRESYQSALPWPPPDWARAAICLVLPLSGTTFSCASAEMKKAIVRAGGNERENAEPLPETSSSFDEGSGSEDECGSRSSRSREESPEEGVSI